MAAAVTLVAHDPLWEVEARLEGERLLAAVSALRAVHHIGSTAIPGLAAKPVIDLLGECSDLETLDSQRAGIEELGYLWRGEYGLPGRRYCVRDVACSNVGRIHLHCYAEGSPNVMRHLAFRDFLRADAALAGEYGRLKTHCALHHRDDSRAYAACKDGWIERVEREALEALRARQ